MQSMTKTARQKIGAVTATTLAFALAVTLGPTGAWAEAGEPAPEQESSQPAQEDLSAEESDATVEAPSAKPKAAAAGATDLLIDLDLTADGTPEWDELDDSTTNGIVRTNDTITYVAHIVSSGAHSDTTLKLDLPQGVVLQSIPGICKADSTLVPTAAQVGDPAVPLTSDSWKSLPSQTLTCNLGAQSDTDLQYEISAKVRPEVPNGATLPAKAMVTSATDTSLAPSAQISHTAAAAPRYDISKNGVIPIPSDGDDQNNGSIWLHQLPCSYDENVLCSRVTYPLWVSTPNGGKGVSPATTLSFTDDLSPEKYFGAGATSNPAWKPEFAPRIGGFWTGSHGLDPMPLGKANALSAAWSVRNSGTPQVDGQPGGKYKITISDADFSALTIPTLQGASRAPLPDQVRGGVISLGMFVEFPAQAILDLGISDGTFANLTVTNTYDDLEVTDIAGQSLAAGADNPRNNTRSYQLRQRLDGGGPGFSLDKLWQRVSADGSLTAIGSNGQRPGDGVIMPGETVASTLTLRNSTGKLAANTTGNLIGCDVWDPKQFTLAPTSAKRDTISFSGTSGSGDKMERVQYGVHAIDLNVELPGGVDPTVAGGCDDSRITWHDSVSDVPGGNDKIGAVRMQTVTERNMNASANNNTVVTILLTAADDLKVNEILPNYANGRILVTPKGSEASWNEILNGTGPQSGNFLSTYKAADNTGNELGHRALTGELTASLSKQVQNRSNKWVDTVEPFSAGDEITFRLSPSLWAPIDGVTSKDVFIEDCLPAGFTITGSSRDYTLVHGADASLDCAAGDSYIRWDLGKAAVGDAEKLKPIEYTAKVSNLIKGGVYRNIARITADGDPAATNPDLFSRVGDKQDVKIDTVKGVFLEKTAVTPVTSVNLSTQTAHELTSWEVRVGNLGDNNPSDLDIIDPLPRTSGTAGNDFKGSMTFAGVQIVEPGAGAPKLYYTTEASVDADPRAAVNWAGGTVTPIWSETAPADLSTVTAVRLVRVGGLADGEQIAFRLDMAGIGNKVGDTYRNTATSVAHSIGGLLTTSGDSQVVASTMGDRAWWDFNQNGIQDDFQGEREPGADSVAVALTGIDDLGNPVSVTTTTNTDGKYSFAGLRPSNADGYIVTFTAPNGATFTKKHADDSTQGTDSDVDASTGASDPIVLTAAEENLTVDAGLIAHGALNITKQLEGAGVQPFGGGDTLDFDVSCTLGGTVVFDGKRSVNVPKNATSVQAAAVEGLPAYSECTVTETAHGKADEAAAPVTVVVPFDAGTVGSVTASLTNYYSAGTISLTKELAGTDTALEEAKKRDFEILVSCQVEESGVRADVFSEIVTFTGGGSKQLEDANGDPVQLPLGASCFAAELETGGATGVTIANDSFENGVIVESGKPSKLQELSLTVLNTFELPNGSLKITKLLEGAGVQPFAGGNELDFNVACSFEGKSVYDETVTLTVPTGATQIVSDELGPFPASTSCTITETNQGAADEVAQPVSVEIPWNAQAWTSGSVDASLTNYYSAGTVQLKKELAGDEEAIEQVLDTPFSVQVTCQIPETGDAGTVLSTLYSGTVKIKGGQTKQLVDDAGDARAFPLGAKCFGEETDNGGATQFTVDHDSFANGAEVTAGTPDELQALSITAVNTFKCDDSLCPNGNGGKTGGLAITGGNVATAAVAGVLLLLAGALLVLKKRRRTADAQ